MKFSKNIENQLAQGNTSEALAMLLKAKETNTIPTATIQEVVMLSGRFNDLEKMFRTGRIDLREYHREKNEINWSVSELLKSGDWDQVEQPVYGDAPQPALTAPQNRLTLLWIIPVILVAGVAYYFSVHKSAEKSPETTVSRETAANKPPAAGVSPLKDAAPAGTRSGTPQPQAGVSANTSPAEASGRFFDATQKTQIGVIAWNHDSYDADVSNRIAAALNESGNRASASVFRKAFFAEKAPLIVLQGNLQQLESSGAQQLMNTVLAIQIGAVRSAGNSLPLSNAMKESGKKYVNLEADCSFKWLKADGSGMRMKKSAVIQSGLTPENLAENALMQKIIQMAASQSSSLN